VPVVLFVIFLLLYAVFHSFDEAIVLIFPTFYAMTGLSLRGESDGSKRNVPDSFESWTPIEQPPPNCGRYVPRVMDNPRFVFHSGV
jgi:hypothetical protein